MDEFQKHRWWTLLDRVGPRLTSATFDNYETDGSSKGPKSQLVSILRNYAAAIVENRKSGAGVLLIGPRGAGKDHLCFCVASAANAAGYSVAWTNGEELFAEARDAMDGKSSEYELSKPHIEADFWWLSDPVPPKGRKEESGFLTDWQMRYLLRIVDARYRHKRPTLVTANALTLKDFEERIGLQVADRLYHDSIRYMCAWDSARKPRDS